MVTGSEAQARAAIDRLLEAAGWAVQDRNDINLGAGLGVAVREFPMADGGTADYLLFVDRLAAGVVEAKKQGVTLSGVAEQSGDYSTKIPAGLPHVQLPLPFVYESTGIETLFRDNRDPEPRSRRVFAFHQPETLSRWLAESDTLRRRLRHMPALVTTGLHDCQIEAITNLEQSLAADRRRALIQMATGSGKTFTAVNLAYRLIQFAKARRVLFLVDRSNLGRQTLREFQQFIVPEDGRKFAELYNIQHLTSSTFDPVSRVCITTIQRLYSMLRGEEFDSELEEHSGFETAEAEGRPREVVYNPGIPIEAFDVIVTDECHRSIYHLWRQVLEYFDAHIIGLTATPSKQTLGFFNQNLVMEYGHERAVADGVNVGYEVYRIRTKITEEGSKVEKGLFVDRRSRLDRKTRWEMLDQDLEYAPNALDRDVVAVDQIRTIVSTFRDALFTEIFPGRTEVPKTLVFAKDDSHAEDIVLFEGGAGETIRRKLLAECDVHTLLRLPTGISYAQGVKANVLFFDRKAAREVPWTQKLWIYDFRTNTHFTLKANTLRRADLDDFVTAYNPENRHDRTPTERFRCFTYDELMQRDKVSLDIFWLKDDSLEDTDSLPPPKEIAADIVEDLEAALEQFQAIEEELEAEG